MSNSSRRKVEERSLPKLGRKKKKYVFTRHSRKVRKHEALNFLRLKKMRKKEINALSNKTK